MNREIKFRAWVDGNILEAISLEEMVFTEKSWTFTAPVTFMQYTGLKDRTGKEIYEGDIIKIAERDLITIVEYEAPTFFCNPVGGEIEGLYGSGWFEQGKVVGNICENPELIKEAK